MNWSYFSITHFFLSFCYFKNKLSDLFLFFFSFPQNLMCLRGEVSIFIHFEIPATFPIFSVIEFSIFLGYYCKKWDGYCHNFSLSLFFIVTVNVAILYNENSLSYFINLSDSETEQMNFYFLINFNSLINFNFKYRLLVMHLLSWKYF